MIGVIVVVGSCSRVLGIVWLCLIAYRLHLRQYKCHSGKQHEQCSSQLL